jgi:hypothetical protein
VVQYKVSRCGRHQHHFADRYVTTEQIRQVASALDHFGDHATWLFLAEPHTSFRVSLTAEVKAALAPPAGAPARGGPVAGLGPTVAGAGTAMAPKVTSITLGGRPDPRNRLSRFTEIVVGAIVTRSRVWSAATVTTRQGSPRPC